MTRICNPNETAPTKKLAVAVSGGCDSLALTFLLQRFCAEKNIELVALTVDHQMRQNSSAEAWELSKLMQQQQIQHHILPILSESVPTRNIEAKLRNLRYDLLLKFCHQNQISVLLLGHHLNDAAENFLIRLFRGSGLDGLSTMAERQFISGILLARPLLNFTKERLQNFLNSLGISWFEDESNSDEKFLRNKIRKILAEFPDSNLLAKRIKSASDEISKARDLFDEIMIDWQKKIVIFNPRPEPISATIELTQEFIDHKSRKPEIVEVSDLLLNRRELTNCPKQIALKILALALIEVSGKQYKPRLSKLQNFYHHLVNNTPNDKIKPRSLYGCVAYSLDPDLIHLRPESTN